MASPKKRKSLPTSAATNGNARPHPSPLPQGEGETLAASGRNRGSQLKIASTANGLDAGTVNEPTANKPSASIPFPLPGERAGSASEGKLPSSDFLLWQLVDSAFPTGGFAHSAGLEAAWQHGEVRGRAELFGFLEASLRQVTRAALPFVVIAHAEPLRLTELDKLCDAFLSNHVANRASRLQGRAFLTAVERIFLERGQPCPRDPIVANDTADSAVRAPLAHYAPVFGACLKKLEVPRETTLRMFVFNHLRSGLAAAVRLNIVGPMEAQKLQHQLARLAEDVVQRGLTLTLNDLAQTAPLLDLWQGAQDRLYSRLFQT